MHRFGVLVPSTNTTIETEYGRLLSASLQVHVARIPLLSSGGGRPRSEAGMKTSIIRRGCLATPESKWSL